MTHRQRLSRAKSRDQGRPISSAYRSRASTLSSRTDAPGRLGPKFAGDSTCRGSKSGACLPVDAAALWVRKPLEPGQADKVSLVRTEVDFACGAPKGNGTGHLSASLPTTEPVPPTRAPTHLPGRDTVACAGSTRASGRGTSRRPSSPPPAGRPDHAYPDHAHDSDHVAGLAGCVPGDRRQNSRLFAPMPSHRAVDPIARAGRADHAHAAHRFILTSASADGDRLRRREDWAVSAVHAPGRLPDRLCFALERDRRRLFRRIASWAGTRGRITPPGGSHRRL